MLRDNFFSIESIDERNELSPQGLAVKHYVASLQINRRHDIFGGHFPGNPVVPGVCQIQMILETLGSAVGKKVRLAESDNIKFLLLINPVANPSLVLDMIVKQPVEGQYSVQATIAASNATFLKFKGNFLQE
jgi:3-hydroxyacyl-[acyl-carrier-protein] dehydratase